MRIAEKLPGLQLTYTQCRINNSANVAIATGPALLGAPQFFV